MIAKTDSFQADGVKVFLCHGSVDKPVIKSLRDRLRADGFWPWLDVEALRPGQPWEEAILEAIQSADAVLVCLSRGVNSRAGYVSKEIKLALSEAETKLERSAFILPIRLEVCEIPKRLTHWQWTDLFEPDGYEKLASAIREQAIATRPAAAIFAYDRILQRNSSDLDALVKRGIAYGNLGHWQIAIQNFDCAIKIDPNYFPAWLERALIFVAFADEGGKWERRSRAQTALESFKRAIDLQPADAYTFFHRGKCYAELFNDRSRAFQDYNQALHIKPDLAEAYVSRGFLLDRERRYDEAIRDFNSAIKLDPQIPRAHLWRGHSHHELSRYHEALKDFDEAVRIEPNDSYAHQYRGFTKQKLSDRPGAQADFAKAKELGYDG